MYELIRQNNELLDDKRLNPGRHLRYPEQLYTMKNETYLWNILYRGKSQINNLCVVCSRKSKRTTSSVIQSYHTHSSVRLPSQANTNMCYPSRNRNKLDSDLSWLLSLTWWLQLKACLVETFSTSTSQTIILQQIFDLIVTSFLVLTKPSTRMFQIPYLGCSVSWNDMSRTPDGFEKRRET